MSKVIYVATIELNSGKSVVVLGLMSMLLGKTAKVGYFRPIIGDLDGNEKDNHLNTVLSYFDIAVDYQKCFAFTRSEVLNLYNQGKSGDVIDEIIRKYKYLEDQFDIVLVEGTDFSHESNSLELDINMLISKNLGLPVIIVARGDKNDLKEIVDNVQLAYNAIKQEADVLSIVVNKALPDNLKELNSLLKNRIHND